MYVCKHDAKFEWGRVNVPPLRLPLDTGDEERGPRLVHAEAGAVVRHLAQLAVLDTQRRLFARRLGGRSARRRRGGGGAGAPRLGWHKLKHSKN